jgi:xylulokinase
MVYLFGIDVSTTDAQCDWITAQVGSLERLLALTGNQVLPSCTAPKIVWVRDNKPNVYDQTTHILLPKAYVRFCLTGEAAVA